MMRAAGLGCCDGLAYVAGITFLLILVSLASPAQCRAQQLSGVSSDDDAQAQQQQVSVAAGWNGSDLEVIFCQVAVCGPPWVRCYCCLAYRDKCFDTMDECRAKCPHCNPHCQPPHLLPHNNSTMIKEDPPTL